MDEVLLKLLNLSKKKNKIERMNYTPYIFFIFFFYQTYTWINRYLHCAVELPNCYVNSNLLKQTNNCDFYLIYINTQNNTTEFCRQLD